MFVTNWISTTKIQKISEITNFFRHYFLSRTEVRCIETICWQMRNKAQIIWYYRRKTVFLRQLKQVNMTNHDFWMSISDIINEGFTSEGLAKLDDYAEQFSTGKILYKRFSPSEQYGCCEGGRIHVIASLLAGAEVGTDQLSAPEQQNQKVS